MSLSRAVIRVLVPFLAAIACSLAALVPAASAAEPEAPCVEAEQLGIVLVIDDSGSTDWNDPTNLRTEASVVALHQQGDGGIFALSTFSTTAVQVVGPSLLSGATRTSAEASIRSRIPARMGTNYQDAFIEAKRQLDSMPATVDKKAVVFVSDGEAGSGYTSDLVIGAAGIPIYTVGFGLAPQDQMAAIAARSQGQTFPVADVAELQPIMAKILAVLECNAQNITEAVTLAPGATESIPFNVSPTEDEFKALASWDTGAVTTTITRPDGTTMNAANLLAGERWDSGVTFASGIGVDPQRGGWIFNLTASPANLANLDVTINVWGGKPVIEPAPVDPEPVVDEPTDITPRSSEHPPPTGCTAIAMSRGASSEVTVSWDAAEATSPDLGGYLVEYRHKGSTGAWTALPTTPDLAALVTGRVPGSSHDYSVRAVYVDGLMSDACVVTVTIPIWRTITGTSASDKLVGGAGRDRINGGSGNDRIAGGAGADALAGGTGNDRVDGGVGNDKITAGKGKDTVIGGSGNDVIDTRDGNGGDVINCGAGRDTVRADPGDRTSATCEKVTR